MMEGIKKINNEKFIKKYSRVTIMTRKWLIASIKNLANLWKILIAGVSGILGKHIFQSFKSNYNLVDSKKNDFKENYFISLDLIQF